LTAKIVAPVDALGNLVRFLLLPEQWHDNVGVAPLIEDIEFDAPFGDKAFDNDWLSHELNQRGASALIPPKRYRSPPISCGFKMCKWRHLVENFFRNLNQFHRIATCYDKTDACFAATIPLAGSLFTIKMTVKRSWATFTRANTTNHKLQVTIGRSAVVPIWTAFENSGQLHT
jgi:transposase